MPPLDAHTGERVIKMKNTYSIAQRNAIVEDHLWCIDSVIRKNRLLMQAAHLDYDDVYQQLAIRLIKAVSGFDPDKGVLKQHIFSQLHYELLNCKAASRRYGLTAAPYDLRGVVVSLDALRGKARDELLLTA